MRRIIERLTLTVLIIAAITYTTGCQSNPDTAGSKGTDAGAQGKEEKTLALEISGTDGVKYRVTAPQSGNVFDGTVPGKHDIKATLGKPLILIIEKQDSEGTIKAELKQAGTVLVEGSTSDSYGKIHLTGGAVRDELLNNQSGR